MRSLLYGLACALAVATPAAASNPPSFEVEPFGSLYRDLSRDGRVMAGSTNGWAVRWVDGEARELDGAPAHIRTSAASQVSDDGSVLAGLGLGDRTEAFRWESGVWEALGEADGGAVARQVEDLSGDGRSVVGMASSGGGFSRYRPFRWNRAEGMVLLPLLPDADWGWAYATSSDGSVVAGTMNWGGTGRTVLWVDGSPVDLGPLPTDTPRPVGRPYAMTPDGSVVVGGAFIAYRWEDGAFELLEPFPDGYGTWATAVSANGQVVVGAADSGSSAFVWDRARGMRRLDTFVEEDLGLDLGGWELRAPQAIRLEAGVIMGPGIDPETGFARSWRLRLPPACRDALDDDGDGRTDYPEDPGCLDPDDASEISRDDVAIDVFPFGRTGRIEVLLPRVVTVAILASETLDVADIDRSSLKLGPGAASPIEEGPPFDRLPDRRDVDRDGRQDLLVRFPSRETGLGSTDEEICLRGEAGGAGFLACAAVRVTLGGCGRGAGQALLLPVLLLLRRRR